LPGSAARRFRGALFTASDGRAEPQNAAPAPAEAARRAGAVILTGCAVRGVETQAGRVSGVVTERGAIACSSVVLAGGAWSRVFCRDLGVTLPQLKVLSSVLRTGPVEGGPEAAAWAPQVAYRRRQDGGFTIAPEGTTVVPLVPDSFAFLRPFIPALRQQGTRLRLRLGERFAREWAEAAPTPLDRPSRYEAVRVLDPKPDLPGLRKAAAAMEALFPGLGRLQVAQQWAGYI
ncbi:FAD-dependent oxidoreductase, partial [Nostoc sp. NIES-2111]